MLLLLLGLTSPPARAGSCEVGRTHRALATAVADPSCEVVVIGPMALWEAVHIDRPVLIVGSGRDETILYCGDRPCVTIGPDAHHVVLTTLSIASTGPTIEARGGHLDAVGVRFSQLGRKGGHVRLRDTTAVLTDVEIEAAVLPAVDAVSHHGDDLDLERALFLGVEPRSGPRNAIYASTYSLRCTSCSFRAHLEDRVAGLLWDDEALGGVDGLSGSHYWPQRYCADANLEAREICAAQCGARDVARCRMAWTPIGERCLPEAICVPGGEIPQPAQAELTRGQTRRVRRRAPLDDAEP